MKQSYLFYDIETTGLNKCFDQIIQFAAIRTDLALNELERHEFLVKLNKDVIPSPQALITHRISLKRIASGINEWEAIQKIHTLFNTPGTISLGYNTLGFDDELIRLAFHRNLLPPYTHKYANNCSRMDIYPMTVACYLFKNELLSWPETNLKLENIARANNLLQGQAHNAIADVSATLSLARCFFKEQATWQYLCGFFDKQTDMERCEAISKTGTLPLAIFVDGKFGSQQQYQSAAMPLGVHHHYKNQTLWLRLDHSDLQEINVENFVEKTWVINKKPGEPNLVLPMKDRFMKSYLQSRHNDIINTATRLQSDKELWQKINDHYRHYTHPKINNLDPAGKLYDAGFLSFQEQDLCKQFHLADWNSKAGLIPAFQSDYLKDLATRVIGHVDEQLLPESLRIQYQQYCRSVHAGDNEAVDHTGKKRYTRNDALQDILHLETNQALDLEQQNLLEELKEFL